MGRSFAELTGVRYPQSVLPFVIPDLQRDIPVGMAITMQLSLQSRDPLVRGMYDDVREYFAILHALVEGIRSTGDQFALARAHRLVSFPEVPEIGFGYSAVGRTGSGVGDGALNADLIRTLLRYPGLSQALTRHPDALYFFAGFGIDRVSDVFATIVKRRLVEYTQIQSARFRFASSCFQQVMIRDIWDGHHGFDSQTFELPVADDGEAVLLVPKNLVRSAPPVQPHQYARFYRLEDSAWLGLKRRIMDENRNSPTKLLRLMDQIFKDPWRYRPRRDLGDGFVS
jgi:hypothetical protein